MDYVDDLPHRVKEIENEWIVMPDGTRLAARMWIPEKARQEPVPAILEYIPYRKRDHTRTGDEINHRFFAGYGYAGIRVDIRGSGDSEGVIKDEYLEQELEDGERIIEWLAKQPWCNGKVGMIGISWGGFNGLQIAARRPEALKAVITVCSTDDRYADDVHYMGGCLLGDNLSWASVMFGRNSLPPDPVLVGERWKELWLQRLEKSGHWLENWLEHQHRDEYWKHGSVCENYDDIQCPVMAVSGWADGYSNSVFRLLKNLNVPRMGLVGPWSHRYPHNGKPGPAIGFLQECVRWWDQWLSNKDTGIQNEPMLKAWVQKSVPPTTDYEERPGYWTGLEEWPSPAIQEEDWVLKAGKLQHESVVQVEDPKALWVSSPLRLGLFAGKWCSYSAPPDLPSDQREEDGGALVFNSPPLVNDLEILGAPSVEFTVSVDKPQAMIAVRLSDVRDDHKVTRVTYGLFNLTHHNSHEFPEPLEPDKKYKVRVQLNEIGHIFPAGHQLRVSVSTSYWPLAWPSPELTKLQVFTDESKLILPVKKERKEIQNAFGPPIGASPRSGAEVIKSGSQAWNVVRDLIEDGSTLEVLKDQGTYRIEELDLEVSNYNKENYYVRNDQLNTLKGEVVWKKSMKRQDWEISTHARTILTSDRDYFKLYAELDAYEGERRIFTETWKRKIPRNLV
ncbi:putative acyl esterase [Catalinimonas alkaloidigena]|uniref:CocE/NonD family hydrolase n=1 Tax=Catalinimonas alkaloidigena TaxID=1075417 RepID=UPI002404EEA8|nr:CocE/NonD family hydrolase [Catalinimonas alkaloidigena]MDF9797643.1 putative acyl esterase [Catalinimonas alkaloidigena]